MKFKPKKNEAWTRFELTTTGCFDWFSRELKRDICSFLAAWFKCHVIILGDLNCNVLGSDPDGCALSDFCSTFGLSQLFKTPTRVTERSKSLIDVALTTNENIIHACDVKQSAICVHSLVSLTLKFKTPRPRSSFANTRSYKNSVLIYARTTMMPPRVLASGRKPCGGNYYYCSKVRCHYPGCQPMRASAAWLDSPVENGFLTADHANSRNQGPTSKNKESTEK